MAKSVQFRRTHDKNGWPKKVWARQYAIDFGGYNEFLRLIVLDEAHPLMSIIGPETYQTISAMDRGHYNYVNWFPIYHSYAIEPVPVENMVC